MSANHQEIAYLQRPWRRIKRQVGPETIFVLAKRNYKVHANIGFTRRSVRRLATIVDTGGGSSFIRKDVLPPPTWKRIRPLKHQIRLKDAGNKAVNEIGTINHTVELGTRLEVVTFYVVERLVTPVILGCDFCDKHVGAIHPRRRVVELDDGTLVPIIRQPMTRQQAAVPLPEAQEYKLKKTRASNKIVVHTPITL